MGTWLVILARNEKRMDTHISGPFTLNLTGMRYVFIRGLCEKEYLPRKLMTDDCCY